MSQMKILVVVVSLLGHGVHAQIADSFSDGDYSTNPAWQGETARFVVSGGRLKLQAPTVSGTAFLATSSAAVHEAAWEFSLQLDFTPSSTNYAKIYLVSDQPDLQGALNGYFVKVGNTSREVSLYRQTGLAEQEFVDGADDRTNQSVVTVRIRVTRSATGLWELFTDVGNSGSFTKEGEAFELTHTTSGWMGIQCVYTATRSDKFWFDDFVVTGTVVPDTSPPTVLRVEALDSLRFRAVFSEPLDPATTSNTNHIQIEGLGSPSSGILQSDRITILWSLPQPLTNGRTYTVQFSGFADLAGNVMIPTGKTLLHFRPGTPTRKSVVITEIFSDPSPQLGLPAAEYIELMNRSEYPFDLKDWKLSDEGSTGTFPSAIILPGEYRVITSSSAASLFPASLSIPIPNFPSLNNGGDVIVLRDARNTIIDSIRYTMEWFRDEDKSQGGWSLELIDPGNPCGEDDNWAASEDDRGGTPGEVNSVLANKPDLTPPFMVSVLPQDATTLSITFNELLGESSPERANISIVPDIPLQTIMLKDLARRTLEVEIHYDLKPRTTYTLSVDGVSDCSGNVMEPSTWTFGLAEPADSLDVVINEVLFNPRSGGADFVEVYNRSEKFIVLTNWTIGNQEERVTFPPLVVRPHQLMACSPDPDAVKSHYPQSTTVLRLSMPNMPDDEGEVIVSDERGVVVDRLNYYKSWHSVFLRNEEGVSLERIDTESPTQEQSNWVSASSRLGYATPGQLNSQHRGTAAPIHEIWVTPEIFVPGNETFGFVQIQYQFDQPGHIANVKIFNHQGAVVRHLANNEWLGNEGFLRWDGEQDNGSRAVAGYYVMWFESFSSLGTVSTVRKRIVIAGR